MPDLLEFPGAGEVEVWRDEDKVVRREVAQLNVYLALGVLTQLLDLYKDEVPFSAYIIRRETERADRLQRSCECGSFAIRDTAPSVRPSR